MRVFLIACGVAALFGVGSALILINVVQESAASAFSTSGVRLAADAASQD